MINTKDLNEAKKLLQNSREKPLIVSAQNSEFNRKILEFGRFDILLFPEKRKKRNTLKKRDSSFNRVLARIAYEKNITIGLDLDEIRKMGKRQKAEELSVIRSIIKTCRKEKCKFKLLNAKDKKDALNLAIALGSSTQQAKEAVY